MFLARRCTPMAQPPAAAVSTASTPPPTSGNSLAIALTPSSARAVLEGAQAPRHVPGTAGASRRHILDGSDTMRNGHLHAQSGWRSLHHARRMKGLRLDRNLKWPQSGCHQPRPRLLCQPCPPAVKQDRAHKAALQRSKRAAKTKPGLGQPAPPPTAAPSPPAGPAGLASTSGKRGAR